jgi:TetR/AcrR family transcriptional regulator, transcriptional repressor for nem operon
MMAAMATEEMLSEPDLRQRVEDSIENFHVTVSERLRQDRDKGLLPFWNLTSNWNGDFG